MAKNTIHGEPDSGHSTTTAVVRDALRAWLKTDEDEKSPVPSGNGANVRPKGFEPPTF
jgi:hypothetical protein